MFDDLAAALVAIDVTEDGRPQLCDRLADVGRCRSALDAFEARVARAIEALDDSGGSASSAIRAGSRCSQREADRRANRGSVAAALPLVGASLAAGLISGEHVDSLVRAVEKTTPDAVAASDLLHLGEQRPADLFERDVRDWIRRQERAGDAEERFHRQRAARSCRIWENRDGMTVLQAEFDPDAGGEVSSALRSRVDALFHADGGRDGGSELRTSQQRAADALHELLHGRDPTAAPNSGPPPVRTTLVVVAEADGTGYVAGSGEPLPRSVIERIACGADLYGLVLDGDGEPLWHGTRKRLASDQQWRALIVRDGGCVICGAHPSKCEAHHVIFWTANPRGPTDIGNLVLVCKHHHHVIHDEGDVLIRDDTGWRLEWPRGNVRPDSGRTVQEVYADQSSGLFSTNRSMISPSTPSTRTKPRCSGVASLE